eukprot:17337-Pelagococcus_subviridis.AAC.1
MEWPSGKVARFVRVADWDFHLPRRQRRVRAVATGNARNDDVTRSPHAEPPRDQRVRRGRRRALVLILESRERVARRRVESVSLVESREGVRGRRRGARVVRRVLYTGPHTTPLAW